MKPGFLFVLLLFIAMISNAQQLSYETYQIGNDYPGVPSWVPHNLADIFVTPEGTVYTNVPWEENGANVTEVNPDGTITRHIGVGNHGGGRAVTANATHIYFAGDKHRTGNEGIDRRDRSNLDKSTNKHVDCGEKVYGLALTSDRVYAAVRELNTIKVYDLELQPRETENIQVSAPEDLYVDREGMLWVLQPSTNKVLRYDPETGNKTDELVLESFVVPTDIAIDRKDNLYVTDISANEQIRIYQNITTGPVFKGTFGQKGGILSGTPGHYAPLKFDRPMGVGVDKQGNIFVGNRAGSGNGSTIIQKYTPSGEMVWDLKCVVWIDMLCPDPRNENIVYTSGEKLRVDYQQQEWKLESLTLDRHSYPDDYRVAGKKHPGATFIRELDGKKFMFLTDMTGGIVNIYKFDGEIAVPTGHVSVNEIWYDANGDGQQDEQEISNNQTGATRGFFVDSRGDIWQPSLKKGIFKYALQGEDAHGALQYSTAGRTRYEMPAPYTELRRLHFYPEKNNLLVLNGFTTGEYSNINHHWKRAGKVFRGYENWSGSFGEPDWEIIPPFEDVSGGNHGDGNIQSFDVADDYVILAHEGSSEELGVSRGHVSIYKTGGTKVGYMEPTPEMGWIGILDITQAVAAYQISSGHYIIAIEDDGKAKIVVYQWCPDGKSCR